MYDFNFAIWDNKEKRLVAYGDEESHKGFFLAMTDKTWLENLNGMVKAILKDTPFEMDVIYY